MTNSEVFKAKSLHYNPSSLEIKDLLDDAGLKPDDNCENKKKVVEVVLVYLSGKRSLASEREADFSESYNPKKLEAHMMMLCKTFGIDPSVYIHNDLTEIEDGSCMW